MQSDKKEHIIQAKQACSDGHRSFKERLNKELSKIPIEDFIGVQYQTGGYWRFDALILYRKERE